MKTKTSTTKRSPTPAYAPLVILPSTTEAETVAAVRAAGYVCVLCDDPSKVKVILPGNDVAGGDLLMSALHGMMGGGSNFERSRMVEELYRRMKEREAGHNEKLS